MMRVLVTGSNGQLGMSLRKIAGESHDFVFTDINDIPGQETVRLDITDKDAVMSMVDAINNISVSINGINDMVKESAGGVQDIAEKTSTVVQKVDSASTFVDTSKESAENLNQIVGGFNLE